MFDRKAYMKQWRLDHKEEIIEYSKQWHLDNPEYFKQYAQTDKEKERKKQWYANHPEYYNQWCRNRRRTDLKFNLNSRITVAIYKSLKGNKSGRHWEFLVGYSLIDLIKRLRETLPEGYTWQECHIDHIIPKSAFNYTSPDHIDFKNCWALSNLQLLPAKENMVKHAKLEKSFQPALRI